MSQRWIGPREESWHWAHWSKRQARGELGVELEREGRDRVCIAPCTEGEGGGDFWIKFKIQLRTLRLKSISGHASAPLEMARIAELVGLALGE